jgi:transcription elongation factor Elf1
MATCSNCGRKLSCGCQKRKASDGRSVCSNCSGTYETKLKLKNRTDKVPK